MPAPSACPGNPISLAPSRTYALIRDPLQTARPAQSRPITDRWTHSDRASASATVRSAAQQWLGWAVRTGSGVRELALAAGLLGAGYQVPRRPGQDGLEVGGRGLGQPVNASHAEHVQQRAGRRVAPWRGGNWAAKNARRRIGR